MDEWGAKVLSKRKAFLALRRRRLKRLLAYARSSPLLAELCFFFVSKRERKEEAANLERRSDGERRARRDESSSVLWRAKEKRSRRAVRSNLVVVS
jgi:hypothetical protein